jgi:hypothetical protein
MKIIGTRKNQNNHAGRRAGARLASGGGGRGDRGYIYMQMHMHMHMSHVCVGGGRGVGPRLVH